VSYEHSIEAIVSYGVKILRYFGEEKKISLPTEPLEKWRVRA
jgi:hypothetical protein